VGGTAREALPLHRNPFVLTLLVGLIAVVVCVGLNAFFVAAEFALVTVRHTWVEELVQGGHRAGTHVKAAVDKLDDAIAATQLGITIASLALGWLGEPAIASLIAPLFQRLAPSLRAAALHSVSVAVAFSTITLLHVVLGELAPKAIALGAPERVAVKVARPLLIFSRCFRPLIWFMNGLGGWVVRRIGFEPPTGHARVHSVGELKMLVEQTHDAGALDHTQAEVVERALEMTDKRIRDVMVPKEQILSIEWEMTEAEVLEAVYLAQHTRMPVWSREQQCWIGIANTKVLLLQHLHDRHIDLAEAMYEPIIFHQAAPLPRALRAFRRRRQHLAFVAGDDGEKIGIVALEDVLEELVGEIEDELDEVLPVPTPAAGISALGQSG
jgi:CBS domain containing-hemolysin-like protein